MRPLLLDTSASIWLLENEPLSQAADQALDAAATADLPTYVSAVTAWELGMLIAKGRIRPRIAPQRWFARLLEFPGVELAAMSPDILIAASFLPGNPPRDPADRILAATARDLGATLITRDSVLLEYGEQGHMSVLGC